MGKSNNTVSGLFSLKEPYGLSPWESIYCGIPVVVSQNSGVAEELVEAGAYSFNPHSPKEIGNALINTFDNFDDTKKKLMNASKKKDWVETAKKLMNNVSKKPRVNMSDCGINAIHVEDSNFIQDGKDLIIKAVTKEYKQGTNGELKELFDSMKQVTMTT